MSDVSRNPDGTFVKGKSGNPGGRKRGVPVVWHAVERLADLTRAELEAHECRDMAEEIARGHLLRAMDNAKDAHYLIDRQSGKTPERLQHEGGGLQVVLKRREQGDEPKEGTDGSQDAPED